MRLMWTWNLASPLAMMQLRMVVKPLKVYREPRFPAVGGGQHTCSLRPMPSALGTCQASVAASLHSSTAPLATAAAMPAASHHPAAM